MILFKKWAKHKVKSYIYCVNQFLREKCHKKWSQECKQKQSVLFNFCNSFDLLIPRTEKIAWWPPVFNLIFTYFSIMNTQGNLKKFHVQVFIVSYLFKYWILLDYQISFHTERDFRHQYWNWKNRLGFLYIYKINFANIIDGAM